MRARPRGVVFAGLVLSAIMLSAVPAGAQGEAAEDGSLAAALTGDARAFYEIGRESFRAGDAAGALGSFHRAYERSSDPRLLWNMAACQASLKHWARALTLVDRYVASGAELLSARDRDKATRFRAAAKRFVATVELVMPPGATVAVDGELAGSTPLRGPLYLDAGKRRVTFAMPGYRGVVRVETVAGESDLTWTITPERLRVRALGP